MPSAPKTRRRIFLWAFPFILLSGVFLVYSNIWHGPDRVVSAALSGFTGSPLQVTGVRWGSWNTLHFERALLSDHDGEPWLTTGPGRLSGILGGSFFSGVRIDVSDAVIQPRLLSGFLAPAARSRALFLSNATTVQNAVLELRRQRDTLTLRLRSLNAEEFRARGKLRWRGEALTAAHLGLQVSERLLVDVPAEWRGRLPRDGQGRRIIKCSFRDSRLTLFGRSGPLLRASWEMAYTTSP